MAEQQTLQDLFHDTLKEIYFAEKKILVALPKVAKAAHSDELRAAFDHQGVQGRAGARCRASLGSTGRRALRDLKLLDATLKEEKATEETLTEIAETAVNQQAEAAWHQGRAASWVRYRATVSVCEGERP